VADPYAVHIGNGVERPRREPPQQQAKLAGARTRGKRLRRMATHVARLLPIPLLCNEAAADGFEICGRIREVARVPILMLNVRSGILDKLRALDLAADDNLTKPFDHLEGQYCRRACRQA
jgi:CheY-like chemotaxis protein